MANLLEGLNPAQREAVTCTEGPVLILAGAGTGKTRVITHRIAHILGRGLAKPSAVLAVTFTNKAAGEMRERVARLVGSTAARELCVSTFHAFCLRVLRAEIDALGYRRDFSVASEGDTRTVVRRLLEDMDGVRESFDAGSFLERIGAIKNSGLHEPPPAPAPAEKTAGDKYAAWLPAMFEQYQSALRAANTLDFDDLLLLTLRLWRERPELLARYQKHFRYVMVDEYQDTNRVQYALLGELAATRRNLCVVGDDDQSIYGWRGADIENILSFERDYPDARIVKLEQNYRSTQTILRSANHVIGHNRRRREKTLWSELGAGRPIDCYVTGDDEHEARMAASWLLYIKEKARAAFSDFAVLYRSNLQSRALEIAFRQAGIPYVVYGGQDFFERSEVRDIIAYLKVLANPRDEAAFLRIVNVPRRGIGDATLHQIHEICRVEKLPFGRAMSEALRRGLVTGKAEQGMRGLLGLLMDFRERIKSGGAPLAALCIELADRIGYRADLVRTSKSDMQLEQRWANVEAVAGALETYEKEAGPRATLRGFLDESALNTEDDRRSRQERIQTGASLMTIHSAKGLEFPFVFVTGLEDGLLPHEKCLGDDALEEERRLFYVALTRGMRHVTLFRALSRSRRGRDRISRPSRFLDELPAELTNQIVRAAEDMVKERVEPTPVRTRRPSKKKAGRARPAPRR